MQDRFHEISSQILSFNQIQEILENDIKLKLSADAEKRINKCRTYLDNKLKKSDEPIYGINTGFGALHDRSISKEDLGKLQKNLVMSHACGIGDEVPQVIVKLMLFLKIQSLSYGNSGVQLATVHRLIDFFNNGILPVVFQYGSLGASGDLAPLAHMSLPLLGMGEVNYGGRKLKSHKVLDQFGWSPLELQSKEGLALLNGTQFMSAFGVICVLKVFKLSQLADVIGALSLDVFDGKIEPFFENVHLIRPHKGQIKTAKRVRYLLNDSELISRQGKAIQDPYSFRCIPQVHGASKDSINYVAYVFKNEINSVTDNPTIFPEEDLIISAGNFHGQPLALALDNLSIAMAELGNISERRTYQLLSGQRDLPPFLILNPGLDSGFMIPQYTAASMVSHNKQLATPASVDSIESSKGQEDHVSMGANAALKAYQICLNLERILAIEFFNAAQALDFRRPLKSSSFLEGIVRQYREIVPFISSDKPMYEEMDKTVYFLRDVEFVLPEP